MNDINRLIDKTDLLTEEVFEIIKTYPSIRVVKGFKKDLNFFKVFFSYDGSKCKIPPYAQSF